ncbi:MAG TPA: cupin domain-containing protein [Cytophagaceae bacterium]|jgi:quercetin dioxygenase-like cupin family protein|nr:cupin domain-containing protein [Cytophagaceae bacterium]
MKHNEIIKLTPGLEIHYCLDADETGQKFTMFKCIVEPNVKVPVPHYHDTFDETFYLLRGKLIVTLDGKTIELNEGEHCFIPKGIVHGFVNKGTETAEILCYAIPGIFTANYFRELSEVFNAGGPPDMAKIKDIMLSYGLVPVVG